MESDEELLARAAATAHKDPRAILVRAKRDGISPEVALEAFSRSRVLLAQFNIRAGEFPPFEQFDALPPASFDPRVLDQRIWWVNYWRMPQRIDEMSTEQLEGIVRLCRIKAITFRNAYCRIHRTEQPSIDAVTWIESSELLLAVRSRLLELTL